MRGDRLGELSGSCVLVHSRAAERPAAAAKFCAFFVSAHPAAAAKFCAFYMRAHRQAVQGSKTGGK